VISSLKGFGLRALGFGLCVLCGANFVACGRKGPPLPPLQRLPSAVTAMTAKRLGPAVVLQFTIPTTNTDLRGPVEVDHVEVYAHTGPLPTPADFLKFGTLVGNVAVKAPVLPGAAAGEQLPGYDLGAVATVSETITPEQMIIGKMPITRAITTLAGTLPTTPELETPGTVNAPLPLMRYYMAVATNRRNRRGAFSVPLAVPLITPFATPAALHADYAEAAVTLEWEPTARTGDVFAPSPAYNLYEVPDETVPAPEGPPVAGAPALNQAPVKPVNPAPLALPAFTDPRMEFGARRCYVVRAVRVAGAISVESAASPPVCLTLADTFPPAVPKSLVSVANEGAIVLIWEPNTEKDLAGYIVLRGEAPDEKLTPLTPMPIHETTYRDTTVKNGVTYVYAVQAVDTAPVPNLSAPSEKVSEVAR
jgi:hypothetical protein